MSIGQNVFASLLLLPCLLVALARADTVVIEAGGSGQTIADYLCNSSYPLLPNATMELGVGTHYLGAGEHCVVQDLTDVTIRGSSEGESIVECTAQTGRGFLFSNVTNLALESVTLRYCGQALSSDLPGHFNTTFGYFGPNQKVVLLFDHCTNITLHSVTVDRYYGIAVVTINSMGKTSVYNVVVSNSRTSEHDSCVESETDLTCSGAGFAFVYSDSPRVDSLSGPMSLDVVNSKVINNKLKLPILRLIELYVNIRSSSITKPLLLTGSSALALYVSQLTYHVDVTIDSCVIENNIGDVSAMVALFYNTIRNTHLLIRNTAFNSNMGMNDVRGGALLLAFTINTDFFGSLPEYPSDTYDAVKVSVCMFNGNSGNDGGAIFFHVTPQNVSDYSILIEKSTFVNNSAIYGSAISSAGVKSSVVSKSPQITLRDVNMYGNRPNTELVDQATILQDSAVVSIVGVYSVEIIGSEDTGGSSFHDNTATALLTSNVNIILRGKIIFENNQGFNGGAISMYDNSILFLYEGSSIVFRGNRAAQSGGAIYANSLGSTISQVCVMQVLGPSRVTGAEANLLNLSITFQNNSAVESGNSIFGDPLYQCFYLPESSIVHTNFYDNNEEVYGLIFNFLSKANNDIAEVTSSPQKICICNNRTFDATLCQSKSFITPKTVSPGQTFIVYLVPVDRVNTPVASVLSSEVTLSTADYTLGPDQNIRRLPGTTACTESSFNIYGPENGKVHLVFSSSTSTVKSYVDLAVESCPPGFVLGAKDGLQQCICSDFVLNTIMATCNTTTYTIARPEQAWFGLHSSNITTSDVVYVSTCPIDYCDDDITEVDLRIRDPLCMKGRTGLLCGACKDGLSTIFGSAECKKCSNAWLGMIVVFALAGVLLVLLLFLLDLTVTHGTIIGLIFYANVVTVNANIFFRGASQGFPFVFISLLNLELGFPLCFYDGMNELAKVGLQYVFPAYLLVICAVIILLSRWVKIVQKLTAKSGVQVLATIFYLSYSKILRTVIDSLTFATLYSDTGDSQPIWLFDGNIHFVKGAHLSLFILALLIIITFIGPYSLYLTLINVIQRFHTSQRLKPFIDAYVAPFKDKWRFWFGLRLVILIVVCIVFAMRGTDDPGLNLLVQHLFVIALMVAQAYILPFKNTLVSLLDLFFLMNLTVLTLATAHIVDTHHYESKQDQVVSAMVALVFIAFCGIIAYHIFITLLKVKYIKAKYDQGLAKAKEWYQEKMHIVKVTPPPDERERQVVGVEMTHLQIPPSERSTMVTTSEVGMEDLADDIRPKAKTFSKLREPVLDYTTY